MKTKLLFLIAVTIIVGCRTSVPIEVRNSVSGKPVGGVQLTRFRDVNRWEKITNPIGSFYHPRIRAESVATNEEGRAELKNLGKKDSIIITARSGNSLVVRLGHLAIPMDPETAPVEPGSVPLEGFWEYYLQRRDGQWHVSLSAPNKRPLPDPAN